MYPSSGSAASGAMPRNVIDAEDDASIAATARSSAAPRTL